MLPEVNASESAIIFILQVEMNKIVLVGQRSEAAIGQMGFAFFVGIDNNLLYLILNIGLRGNYIVVM